ncbi:MAG: sulfate ABC transporter permease subunit CysT [Verrucomicrobiales bacterium]|jgi:sulfate transport system permease protein|nr:sulfate ABC transporter permease subunit CysT [Verrucomicrobiales bacterium]
MWFNRHRQHRVLPGFGLTMGFTLTYLSLLILIPLAGVIVKSAELGWPHFWHAVSGEFAIASYKLSFGASLAGAAINGVFGLMVAWVLVRYDFPCKRLIDSLVDLPFALPTAVAGIALTTIYSQNGWIGRVFAKDGFIGSAFTPTGWFGEHFPPGTWLGDILPNNGIPIAYTATGVTIALTFIGLPFVVRTVQPILTDLSLDFEEAAASLGANYVQIFFRVILPELLPALLTGFSLAFARALGEYGSVIFIAGNIPGKTEITPRIIVNKLEEYDYSGAAAVAVVMLIFSFLTLLTINLIQWWSSRFYTRI